jgi:hypothetical protein
MAASELAPVTTPTVTALAERADDAVFAGDAVDEQQVAALWSEVDEVLDAAGTAAGRRRRLLSRYRVAAARRWGTRVVATATQALPPTAVRAVGRARSSRTGTASRRPA